MARLRKNETSANITPSTSSAAPARRKTTVRSTPRTRATAKPDTMSTTPAPEEPAATPAVTAVSATAIIEYSPLHEEVATLAYTYWVERGYADGFPNKTGCARKPSYASAPSPRRNLLTYICVIGQQPALNLHVPPRHDNRFHRRIRRLKANHVSLFAINALRAWRRFRLPAQLQFRRHAPAPLAPAG